MELTEEQADLVALLRERHERGKTARAELQRRAATQQQAGQYGRPQLSGTQLNAQQQRFVLDTRRQQQQQLVAELEGIKQRLRYEADVQAIYRDPVLQQALHTAKHYAALSPDPLAAAEKLARLGASLAPYVTAVVNDAGEDVDDRLHGTRLAGSIFISSEEHSRTGAGVPCDVPGCSARHKGGRWQGEHCHDQLIVYRQLRFTSLDADGFEWEGLSGSSEVRRGVYPCSKCNCAVKIIFPESQHAWGVAYANAGLHEPTCQGFTPATARSFRAAVNAAAESATAAAAPAATSCTRRDSSDSDEEHDSFVIPVRCGPALGWYSSSHFVWLLEEPPPSWWLQLPSAEQLAAANWIPVSDFAALGGKPNHGVSAFSVLQADGSAGISVAWFKQLRKRHHEEQQQQQQDVLTPVVCGSASGWHSSGCDMVWQLQDPPPGWWQQPPSPAELRPITGFASRTAFAQAGGMAHSGLVNVIQDDGSGGFQLIPFRRWQQEQQELQYQRRQQLDSVVAVACGSANGWYSSSSDRVWQLPEPVADHWWVQQPSADQLQAVAADRWVQRTAFARAGGMARPDLNVIQDDGGGGRQVITFKRWQREQEQQQRQQREQE